MRRKTKLFCENTSPNIKRLTLMKRAGLRLTENEKKRLNETVTQILPMRLGDKMGIQNSISKSMGIDDIEDNDEVDLESILKELGYGEDDVDKDDTISDMSRDELKELIQSIVLTTMEEEDDLNEIIENLVKDIEGWRECLVELDFYISSNYQLNMKSDNYEYDDTSKEVIIY